MNKETTINELKKVELHREFDSFEEALDFFAVLEAEDIWLDRKLRNFSLSVTNPFSEVSLFEATKEQTENAKNSYSYILSTGFEPSPNEKEVYILNPDALFSVKQRAGLSGKLLTDLENSGDVLKRKSLAEIINMAWEHHPRTKCKVLLRSGQILSVHGAGYAPLPQVEIFKEVQSFLMFTFPEAKFKSGYYSHNMTELLFSLSDYKDNMMTAYVEAWEKAGMDTSELEGCMPALKFMTSDTAEYCFTICPMFIMGNQVFSIGEPLKLKHQGNADMEAVKNKLAMVFNKLTEGVNSLSALFEIEINYPVPTFIRLADEIGLLKSAKTATKAALDFFTIFGVPETINAFALYNALYVILTVDEYEKLSASGKLKVTENLSRLLSLDFKKFDRPGRTTI